jgi:hypothetical protein
LVIAFAFFIRPSLIFLNRSAPTRATVKVGEALSRRRKLT